MTSPKLLRPRMLLGWLFVLAVATLSWPSVEASAFEPVQGEVEAEEPAAEAELEPPVAPTEPEEQPEPPAKPERPTKAGKKGKAEPKSSIEPRQARMGDVVAVRTEALAELVDKAGGDCNQIVLVLDHLPLKGMEPRACNPETGIVSFELERVEGSAAWESLLGSPSSFSRDVPVGIGTEQGLVVELPLRFELIVLPHQELLVFIFFWISITVLFSVMIHKGGLLLVPVSPQHPTGHQARL